MRSRKLKLKDVAAIAVIIACAAALAAIYIAPVEFSADKTADGLWRDGVTRALLACAIIALIISCGYTASLTRREKGTAARLLWCLPLLLVAAANFPYSALADGSATVTRPDLIWLFIIKCVMIALSEELLFRGFLLEFLKETFKGKSYEYLKVLLLSSAIFALFHLLNLFEGAGAGATFLQVGYTFLTGITYAAATLHTGNIWAAVFIHALFDVGGLMIGDIGEGPFQDGVFWALTAIAAAICAVHLILHVVKMYNGKDKSDGQAGNTN